MKIVPEPLSHCFKKHKILIVTLIGVITGVILGFSLRPCKLSPDTILVISYPGELFMRCLKLIILPLIVTSLIAGTASFDINLFGKIAIRTFVLFCVTSLFNAIMGTMLVLMIRPGDSSYMRDVHNSSKEMLVSSSKDINLLDSLQDLGRNIIADNWFLATFQSTQTVYISDSNNSSDMLRKISYRSGTNTLGLVFFCACFGTAVGMIGEKGRIITQFFQAVFEVVMKLVVGVMWLTPICVCSIITGKILDVSDVGHVMTQLGWFIVTVVLGLAIYHFGVMQIMYFVALRRNPLPFYCKLIHPMLTAAACASTAAALPVTFQVMDNELKIDPRITKFILPIGANCNTDGTAVMISVSSIFIAQMNGIDLGVGQIATVCLLAFTSSLAVSSVPSSALIMIIMVLSTLNVPTQDVMLLFAVDWFLDRLRTATNMLSDCYVAAIVEHLSKPELALLDRSDVKLSSNSNDDTLV